MDSKSYSEDNLPIRGQVLAKASACTLGDRNKAYGDPTPDMELAAAFKALYKSVARDKYSPQHDEAIDRVFVKLARIAVGSRLHTDNYVDGAAYLAIAAECEQLFENGKEQLSPKDAKLKRLCGDSAAGKDVYDRIKKLDEEDRMQTTGPLMQGVQIFDNFVRFNNHDFPVPIGYKALAQPVDRTALTKGTLFMDNSGEGREIIEIMPTTEANALYRSGHTLFRAKFLGARDATLMNARGILCLLERNAKANMLCRHCPEDAQPGKDVCEGCEG